MLRGLSRLCFVLLKIANRDWNFFGCNRSKINRKKSAHDRHSAPFSQMKQANNANAIAYRFRMVNFLFEQP